MKIKLCVKNQNFYNNFKIPFKFGIIKNSNENSIFNYRYNFEICKKLANLWKTINFQYNSPKQLQIFYKYFFYFTNVKDHSKF